ncbi:asparaginase [Pseudomonas sp. R5(2019)]|uniref:asparaginase n=1 Tax=Pseudomonas sp. R5(2019) TaxID=2697566 RepID=UPI0014132E3D|nr:asparaginase [Pseudomonas sp. R5(2019)]NBA94846.1 asparaginase [Pseudomonas sp. R5(2019)]
MNSEHRPKIAVIGTGGTFAMQARNLFDWVEYSESGVVLPIDHLLEQLGAAAPHIECVPVPFRALGSTAITPADWLELARLIERTASERPDIEGFVITHGTATLEETAYFLDLALDLEVGLVLTGAQRPLNTAGSDVLTNLRAALAVASCEQAKECGALVVMDNKVYSARDVSKSSSFDLNAFEAVPFGPLAQVDALAQVHWRRFMPVNGWHARFQFEGVNALARVDIATSYAGADDVVIDALVAAGSRAIICAGLAPGRPAAGEMAAIRRATAGGVVVVQATRAVRGHVPPQAFLERDSVMAGGDLSPHKLRILLMLALTQNMEASQLQACILAA